MKNEEKRKIYMPEEMLRELMISKGVDKAGDVRKAWDKVREEYKGEYLIPTSEYVKVKYGKTIQQILNIKSGIYMPEEMLRELMISKGVDKAGDVRKAWDKVREEYKGEYLIPTSGYVKVKYGKTIQQILEIRICISEEMLRELMISKGVDKAGDKYLAWDKVREEYKEYLIPTAEYVKVKYGKTIQQILNIKSGIHISEEMLRKLMISKGVDKADDIISAWNKVREEYKGVYFIPSKDYVKLLYGKSIYQLLNLQSCINQSFSNLMPEEMLRELMISKGVDKAGDKYLAWNEIKREYSGEYFIPEASAVKQYYGKTIFELIYNYQGCKKFFKLISFLTIHIEDLIVLDKPQLLQIAQLGELPKDIHEEIINCPMGESRRNKLLNVIDELKNKKDVINEDSKTFDDILKEVIKEPEPNSQSEEENKFFDELHSGIDTTITSKVLNPKKSMDTILIGIDALGNFKENEFTGPEAIDYLVKSELMKLWNATISFNDRTEAFKVIEKYMMKRSGSEFFRKIIEIFLTEYKEVFNLEIPKGYSFPYEPLIMQKLTAYKVITEHQVINCSETGAGKTNSGVISARCIDSRITFVIAVNSTINNWTDNAIKKVYPDSKIYLKTDISDTTILDRNFYNYVVVNYEEFQNPDKFLEKWKPFLENNKVDFVILDEVQKVKSSNTKAITNRRMVIENLLQIIDLKNGRDLEKEGRVVPVLALSATPVINTLNEGLSILSLLKGIDYTSVRNTRRSALACHFELVKCGLRMTEELPASERTITFPIKRDSNDISETLKSKSLLVSIDRSGCLTKIGECIRRGYLQPGIKTIIYTDLVTDVIDQISLYLQGCGFKVGEFTGRNEKVREYEKEKFIKGDYDILLASEPISTGVDGLQYVCGQMIILVSPWTYAEYHQLVGRINRKGTVFSEIKIIIPTIEYTNKNGDIWSLDNNRLARIKFKQTLADVIMTGEIPDEIITIEEARKLASKKLIEFINAGGKGRSERSETPIQAEEIKPSNRERHRGHENQRDYFSVFQSLNQRISTSTCEGVFSKIIKSKEDWTKYHKLRENAMGSIQDQPIQTIARDLLKSKKHKVLGDMGCGMNRLKTLLPENYEVISVDMYAADNTVNVCNLIDTSNIIPNESLDIAVYCLSLWSRNWREILKDAYRVLDYDGKIIIVEPISSSSKSIDKMKQALSDNGFINISITKDGEDKFYYTTASK